MIKKNFATALRSLRSRPLFTSLNLFGLALGISTCWIIYRIVSYEFSYDSGLPHKERVYRVISGFVFDVKPTYSAGVSTPIYQGLRHEGTGLDLVVPVFGRWVDIVKVDAGNAQSRSFDDVSDIVATDTAYFTMVPYRWIAGNKSSAFRAPGSVVLTEARAQKYFPGASAEEILHRTLTYYSYQDTVQRTITGIVADLKQPTEFTAQEFISLPVKAYELISWSNTDGSNKLYLRLNQGTSPDRVKRQIESMVAKKVQEFQQKNPDNFKFSRWYELMPIKESHFSTYIEEYARKASKPILYGLIGTGFFLLLLACINYVNMSMAVMPLRSKEIGVRKTLGSSHSQLVSQFLAETFLTTLIASVFALVISLCGFWILGNIVPAGITPFGHLWELVAFLVLVSLAVTIMAGLYPAWLITRVRVIHVFRQYASGAGKMRAFSLQKALIVFQFVIALAFIACAFIVGNQLHYTLTTNMGFNKDAVVLVEIPWKTYFDKKYTNRQFTLLPELKSIPGVQKIAMGSAPLSGSYSSGQYEYATEGRSVVSREVYRKWVDTGYLSLYGIPLVAGRNLRPSDTVNECLINLTAVQAFGFKSPEDAIGKLIGQRGIKFPIVGVVRDFHVQNFYKTIDPILLASEKDNLSTFNIKLAGTDPSGWHSALEAIEKKWYQFYPPGTFKYKFYDEALEEMYKEDLHLARVIDLATGIAIFIGCLGLFGLSAYTAYRRTKEIGIRKVLGASVSSIVRLLSREYLFLVMIAIIIAMPIAWWASNKWLQGFAYRIELSWWLFALSGLAGIAVAFITVSFQSVKAAMTNPVESLRNE